MPDIGAHEQEAVCKALSSGWLTTGPVTKRFECDFAAFLGEEIETIAVNSATSGLHLALEALGVGVGDEVIVPSLTFTATAEVARYLGADPVFVEVMRDSLTMDPDSVRRAISPRTKAIIPVHYGGISCDMPRLLELAREVGVAVVEDAAHALPTTCKGKLIGTLDSDITVFSFYANKTMTTGEGGMIVTRSKELAKRMKIMRLHGIDRDAFERFRSERPSWYYEVVAPGFKYNLTDLASAIGIEQLKRLPEFLERRTVLAQRYHEELAHLPLVLPAQSPTGDTHAWHLYVVRLSDEAIANAVERDWVIRELADKGIGTSVHYVPLHRQPYWRDRYGLLPGDFPVTEAAYQSMFSIPIYTRMTQDDQQRVIEALHAVLS
ncbi:aminotransferase class V-fold PLP-dependent enzyme [Porphyrobacter algicida]|uniref:Aminotransferase class V-fold PLP-dependent enzyme n=2 Tax=Qipengyuania algicida TaxID=1836209 RepID=A0A845ABZ6_9SPHN|nr:aminotransferase class V-fold PLP-dependent enzyme [Qipengyuania algicida]